MWKFKLSLHLPDCDIGHSRLSKILWTLNSDHLFMILFHYMYVSRLCFKFWNPCFDFEIRNQICTFFWSTILWDSRAKRIFPAFHNIFYVYLVRWLHKLCNFFFTLALMCYNGQMLVCLFVLFTFVLKHS